MITLPEIIVTFLCFQGVRWVVTTYPGARSKKPDEEPNASEKIEINNKEPEANSEPIAEEKIAVNSNPVNSNPVNSNPVNSNALKRNPEDELAGSVTYTRPDAADIQYAFQEGFRSPFYTFLESKVPIDTLPEVIRKNNLGAFDRLILSFKRIWLKSPYPAKLAEIVDAIIRDRKKKPISKVVCLGIRGGSLEDVHQTVVLLQVISQLATSCPEILDNIYVQDPAMTAEGKDFFENHGCKVVNHPRAWDHVGPNTLLCSFFVHRDYFVKAMIDRKAREVAMFIGNGEEFILDESAKMMTWDEDVRDVILPMFDQCLCNMEDMPCDRHGKKEYGGLGTMVGLTGVDIWWRPVRNKKEIYEARLAQAIKFGFPPTDVDAFSRGYHAGGLGAQPHIIQMRIVANFIARCYTTPSLDFEEHVRTYLTHKTKEQTECEKHVARWLSIVNDDKVRDRTFREYMEGDRELS